MIIVATYLERFRSNPNNQNLVSIKHIINLYIGRSFYFVKLVGHINFYIIYFLISYNNRGNVHERSVVPSVIYCGIHRDWHFSNTERRPMYCHGLRFRFTKATLNYPKINITQRNHCAWFGFIEMYTTISLVERLIIQGLINRTGIVEWNRP